MSTTSPPILNLFHPCNTDVRRERELHLPGLRYGLCVVSLILAMLLPMPLFAQIEKNWSSEEGTFDWNSDHWGSSPFADGDSVLFSQDGVRTITYSTSKDVADMTIRGTGTWTFSATGAGVGINGIGSLLMDASRDVDGRSTTVTLTGNNNFMGGVSIESGTLIVGSAANLGTNLRNLSFLSTAAAPGTLRITGNTTFTATPGTDDQRLAILTNRHGRITADAGTTLTIQGNTADTSVVFGSGRGGAIYIGTNATLGLIGEGNFVFRNNTAAQNGGAIFSESSSITINDRAEFSGNSVTLGGGGAIWAAVGSVAIGNSAIFENNTVTYSGGAIYALGDITMNNDAVVEGNTAGTSGGALFSSSGIITLGDRVRFGNNTAGSSIGGAMVANFVTVGTDAEFSNNSARSDGGAIYSTNSATIGDRAEFTGNESGASGGAIYAAFGNITIGNEAIFDRNTAGIGGGGAIHAVSGDVAIGNNASFGNNTAAEFGGAIMNNAGNVTLGANSYFHENTATQGGGAIAARTGNISVNGHAYFAENSTDGLGGAILHLGTSPNTAINLNTGTTAPNTAIAFSGNRAGGSPNSIHMTQGTTLALSGNGNIYFDDPISSGTGGNNRLTKTGTGFVQFADDNRLNTTGGTGNTVNIADGTFRLVDNAAFDASGAGNFNVANGAALAGQGTISLAGTQTFTIAGTVSPDAWRYAVPDWNETTNTFGPTKVPTGSGIGTLTLAGNAIFTNATLEIDIASNSLYDRIAVTGTATLTGTTTVQLSQFIAGDYAILTSDDLNYDTLTMSGLTLTDQQRVRFEERDNALMLIMFLESIGQKNLTWTGADSTNPGIWASSQTQYANWTDYGQPEERHFLDGDSVTFASERTGGGNIFVGIPGSGGTSTAANVTVGDMTVNANNWNFSGGSITGDNLLLSNTAGTVVLANDVAFASTTISAGTLQIGNGGETGSISGNITLTGGQVVFDRSDEITYSGVFSGTGNVTQSGTGTLTLTGNSFGYGGTFTQQAGTVHLTGLLGGNFSQNADTAFYSNHGASLRHATLRGSVDPTGTLNVTGNLTLNGAILAIDMLNTQDYLNVTGTASLTGVTIDLANYEYDSPYTILNSAGLTVNTNIVTLWQGNALSSRVNVQYATPDNSLVLTLSAQNLDLTWHGNDGYWRDTRWYQQDPNNLERFINNDSVNFMEGSGIINLGSMNGNGNGNGYTVSPNDMRVMAGQWTFTNGEIAGSGDLTILGNNTVAVFESDVAFASTTVSAGTLQIGNGGETGSISGNIAVTGGQVVFDRSDEITYSGVFSGTGNVMQSGTGTLTLTGNSSGYGGTFTQQTGTVHLTGALGGEFVQNDGTFSSAGNATLNDATFHGTIKPEDTLHITGELVLDGATLIVDIEKDHFLNVSGMVEYTEFTIDLTDFDNGVTRTIIDSAGLNGDYSSIATKLNGNDLNDARQNANYWHDNGSLMMELSVQNMQLTWQGGSGTWNTVETNWLESPDGRFIDGDAVLFQGTEGGNVNIATASGSAIVADMTVTGRGDWTFTGNIIADADRSSLDGQGKLVLDGDYTGTVTLNGNNTFVGGVDILGGTLAGQGLIEGFVQVKAGGTISARSLTGSLTLGNGIIFEDNSTFAVNLNTQNGSSSVLVVADGTITIGNNVMLAISNAAGEEKPTDGQQFLVIAADLPQFVNGTDTLFVLPESWTGFFDQQYLADGEYGPAGFYLIGRGEPVPPPSSTDFGDTVRGIATENAQNVADALDREDGSGPIHDLLRPITDPRELADALAKLHGEVFASSQLAVANMQRSFQSRLPSASGYSGSDAWSRWGSFFGDWKDRQNIGGYSGYKLQSSGVTVGMDKQVTYNSFSGFAVGYENAYQNFRTIQSSDQIDAVRTMLYGGMNLERVNINAYAGYTKHWHQTRRDININDFSAVARSRYNDDMFSFGMEFDRAFSFRTVGITPSVGVHSIHLSSPSITEYGAGDANLQVQSRRYTSVRLPMGVKVHRDLYTRNGLVWTPEFRASYICDLGDTSARATTSFANASGNTFIAGSGNWGRSSGRVGIGLNMQMRDRLQFRMDYDYEVFEHTATSEFGATLGVRW
ncbi:MAG: autotransporter domain-containing protein [Planctomycetaceae bacterium]|nr:autotransporter domain-containing protein [Planctomycetaceae bacterium]